jgi:Ca-activated chloride channel family protein
VADFARQVQGKPGELAANREQLEERSLKVFARGGGAAGPVPSMKMLDQAVEKKDAYKKARAFFSKGDRDAVQAGKLGVDLSLQTNNLRNQSRLEQTAQRTVNGRNCLEVGGVWIDEGFDPKMPAVTVKSLSDAYFRILELQPKMKEVFQLANYLVWVTPNGTALVIDLNDGKEKLEDGEIDRLFVAKK